MFIIKEWLIVIIDTSRSSVSQTIEAKVLSTMLFKIIIFTLAFVAGISAEASAEAKPAIIAPIAYTSSVVVGAPVVTATSSQFIARNYNGVEAPVAYTAYSPYAYTPYAYAVNPVSPLKYSTFVSSPIKYTAATVVV